MSEFQELLQEELKNPEFKKEQDNIQPEMDVIRAMIDARIEQNLTQKELANGLEMQLKISFVPIQTQLRKQPAFLLYVGKKET